MEGWSDTHGAGAGGSPIETRQAWHCSRSAVGTEQVTASVPRLWTLSQGFEFSKGLCNSAFLELEDDSKRLPVRRPQQGTEGEMDNRQANRQDVWRQ